MDATFFFVRVGTPEFQDLLIVDAIKIWWNNNGGKRRSESGKIGACALHTCALHITKLFVT